MPPASADLESDILLRLRELPEIFEAIRLSSPAELAGQKHLRERFDEELVRAALSIHEARQKAIGKLPDAELLWLTRVGLEQSTSWSVARHKARRFRGNPVVIDLCCGIGVDASNIATEAHVLAVDSSHAMCIRSGWNAEIWGRGDQVETMCGDAGASDWAGQMVHVDPDRRAESDRPTKRLELYQPNLEWMQKLSRTAAGGAIKIGPASNFLQKFPGCEIELISLDGECREATVWFGSLGGLHSFRATVLPSGESISADPLSAWTNTTEQLGRYLFDPDPAIVRSGLLDVMAEHHQLLRLDADEEYLTADTLPETSFVTAFEVEVVLPNNIKDLKKYLRNRGSRNYEIKCRRIPTQADAVRRQLPVGDEIARVIFFARLKQRSVIVVARRIG
ncbi:MAG: class I SAM-dependent methyltransferase [Planctomycetota bacterium]